MRCANYIQDFPSFTFTFVQYTTMGIKEYFNVTLPPEMYLQETDDNTRCLSHFRPINKDSTAGFKLGSAFFRNVSVELEYIGSQITINTKPVNSPLANEVIYPPYDSNKYMQLTQTIQSSGQYQSNAYVGTPQQGADKKWAYSTSSFYSVVPSANDQVTNGWFDASASSSYSDTDMPT